ncbi:MAG: hypothetical protein LBQ82_04490 [Treponema sp.]|jgi:hypothetical protein|nr:hypothetical protein [Treponema sp.]
MNFEKLKENVDAAQVVEELIAISKKVFGKCDDEVKKVVEIFITESYLMGKKNQVKTFEE